MSVYVDTGMYVTWECVFYASTLEERFFSLLWHYIGRAEEVVAYLRNYRKPRDTELMCNHCGDCEAFVYRAMQKDGVTIVGGAEV